MIKRYLLFGLSRFFLLTLFFWSLDLLSGALVGAPMLRNWEVPLDVKVLLLAANFSIWAVLLGAPSLFLRLLKPVFFSHRLLRKIGNLALLALSWVFSFFYFFSSALYQRAHDFIGFDGVYFLRWNFGQFMDHIFSVEAKAFYMLTMISLLSAFLIHWGVKKIYRGVTFFCRDASGRGWLWKFVCICSITMLIGILSPKINSKIEKMSPGETVFGSEKVRFSRSELFRYILHYHTGPMTRILIDGIEYKTFQKLMAKETEVARERLLDEKKRVITMEEYLKGVSDGSLKKYNVIYVLIESLRPDCLKVLGAKREIMPFMDEFVKETTLFSKTYTQSSHSNYSDLCMLNSQFPLRSKITYYIPENPTYQRLLIFDILKAVGYKTALISSQNEKWGGMYNYLDTGGLDELLHSENFSGPTYIEERDNGFLKRVQSGELNAGKIEDSLTIQRVIEWLNQNHTKPFFLQVNLQNSHFPYHFPQHMVPKYGPHEIDFFVSFVYYPKEKVDVIRNRYDSTFYYLDEQLKKLIDELKCLNLLENTILVLTGDNGEAFYEHENVTHGGKLFDEMIHVPLLMTIPGKAPEINASPMEQIDVAPTILGLIGLPPHPAFQGVDVLDPGVDKDRPMFFVAQNDIARQTAMIKGRYKLIHDWKSWKYHLFDLERDPQEKQDLVKHKIETYVSLKEILSQFEAEQLLYYDNPDINSEYYPPDFK